jgi:hypothetical protein
VSPVASGRCAAAVASNRGYPFAGEVNFTLRGKAAVSENSIEINGASIRLSAVGSRGDEIVRVVFQNLV